MKKKIKDLTLEECNKICKAQSYCEGCPLLLGIDTQTHFVSCYQEIINKKEQEVELDESNDIND